jgi:hypothetical protein
MTQRLTERFAVGDWVEITFGDGRGDNRSDGRSGGRSDGRWQPARLARHDPPGVWVQTMDGRFWFVTNTRRIRPLDDENRSRAETPGA